jgi:3-deoxy-7-phosphoheptulonate synthase
MIIVLKPKSSEPQIQEVAHAVKKFGYEPRIIRGVELTVIAAVGDERRHHTLESLTAFPQVDHVTAVQKRYKLVSRDFHKADTTVRVGGVLAGPGRFHVIAGPCSVETERQTLEVARAVRDAGATLLRGGAFKPRTSPYDFSGLGKEGLGILKKARQETGMPIVTEVMSPQDVEAVSDYADMLQIGTRNAQNFALLHAAGQSRKPVFLKRGMSATVEEWLNAAEHIAAQGNSNIILCERGIRTFETSTRFTLDLNAVAVAKKETHLPVFVDPSHGVGRADLIVPLARAAAAVDADGLMIEVHPDPKKALSDGAQQMTPDRFAELMAALRPFVELMGRKLG